MTRHFDPTGFVYVIRPKSGGLSKIGWSQTPKARLQALAIGSPVPLELVGVIEGPQSDEMQWHLTFRDKHSHGEWFDLTDEDIASILHDSFGIDRLPDKYYETDVEYPESPG